MLDESIYNHLDDQALTLTTGWDHLGVHSTHQGFSNGTLPSLEAALLSCSMTSRIRFGIHFLTMAILATI